MSDNISYYLLLEARHSLKWRATLKIKTLHQALQGGGQHLHIAGMAVGGVAAYKGNSVAADNGYFANITHNRGLV